MIAIITFVFQATSSRPDSRKVLVIITDSNPTNGPDDIIIATEPLNDSGIKIITVGLGMEVDPVELYVITPNKDNALDPKDSDTPKEIAETIMKKILNGNISFFNRLLHLI